MRNAARVVALKAYRESGGDIALASEMVRERMRLHVGSIWITLAVTLAIELIKWWLNNRTAPEDVAALFQPGEPGWSQPES